MNPTLPGFNSSALINQTSHHHHHHHLLKHLDTSMQEEMGRGSVLVLVIMFALIVLSCASTASVLAKEDPELKQCKHQCRHQRQREHCERQCDEEYTRQKRAGGEDQEEEDRRSVIMINPRDRPEQQQEEEEYYRRSCRERCQHQHQHQQHGREEEGRRPREQQECESRCRREQERRRRRPERDHDMQKEEEEEEGRNPYLFQEDQFRSIEKSQHGRIIVLPKFTERSKQLFNGIDNYRVEIFEASPHTFTVPKHSDADSFFFVAKGKGKVTLVHRDRRNSFHVELGHIMRIPAGVTAYMINTDDHEKLTLVKLLIPIATPGHFESFFGAGGDNPESYFRGFSNEILEAALKVPRDQFERVFERQRDGFIIKASREQIRALSEGEDEGGEEEGGAAGGGGGSRWPFGGGGRGESKGEEEKEEEEGPFNLLKQRPTLSNQYGKLMEVKPEDCKTLNKTNMAISFVNISQGSMTAPFFNSRSTKISVVVGGKGYWEMACPHMGSSSGGRHGRRQEQERERGQQASPVHYKKVSSELRCGTVFIVPAGHPFVAVASPNDNLEIVSFELNAEENERLPIAGKSNIFKNFEKEAVELAFKARPEEVRRVFESQREDFFFPGPRHHRQGRADA
ncbi:hypothetical protein Dimus_016897 [Dionaea muscipula]